MYKRIVILLAAVLSLASLRVEAQDALFSQFFANPLYLNPAFAGTNVCPRFAFNFRDQWPNMAGNFMTTTASYDEHFDKLSGGIGILLFHDRAGANGGYINTSTISAMYAFKAKVSKKFTLRLALQADFQGKFLNWNNLTFPDMIDPRYGFVYQTNEVPGDCSRWNFGVGAGILGYTPHVYFGLALHHLASVPMDGTVGFSFLGKNDGNAMYTMMPLKLTAHVGANFDLKRKSKKETSFGDISISPNVIFQYQAHFHYLNEGFYLNFYPFTVGCWLRESFTKLDGEEKMQDPMDAFIMMFGVEYKWFKVAYSYDITLGRLSSNTGGAHEVTLQLNLPCPNKRQAMKDLKCPSF